MKNPTSFRLSPDAIRLLAKVAKHWGLSRTAVVEMLVRAEARREGVK